MTKALHPKRPALIPMLDSVVQPYLAKDGPGRRCLVRGPRRSRSCAVSSTTWTATPQRSASSGHELSRSTSTELTEVRILDVLIWSVAVPA